MKSRQLLAAILPKSLRRAAVVFAYFFKAEPWRGLLMLGSMIFGGLLEGISIVALLPLLNVVVDGDGESQTRLGRLANDALAYFGLEPTIPTMLLILVTVTTGKALLMLLATKQIGYTVAQVTMKLRLELLRRLLDVKWSYFVRQKAGSLSAAFATEPAYAASCYNQICRIFVGAIQISIYAAFSLAISWEVSLAAAVVGLLSFILLRQFVVITGQAGRRHTKTNRSLLSGLIDGLQSMKPVKAMGREKQFGDMLVSDISTLREIEQKLVLSRESLNYIREALVAVSLAGVLYMLLTFWKPNFESLAIMALLFLRLVSRTSALQTSFQNVAGSMPAFFYIMSVLRVMRSAREPAGTGLPPSLTKSIKLAGVHFSYGRRPVLENVDLDVPVGSFAALIGPSGSGKTTIADIICGLARPTSGQVLIDDRPMNKIDMSSWRREIGYVPQETVLFHDTVLRNITLGDEAISEEEVKIALQKCDAWDFVEQMPLGIHTVVGERGSRLSGGQRQRLAIARALVAQPDLLILDEATTALDPETERGICRTMQKLAGQVTIIAISHQPAIQESADLVFIVSEGKVTPKVPLERRIS